MSEQPLTLAGDFPEAVLNDWLARVGSLVPGREPDDLSVLTAEGIRIAPLYTEPVPLAVPRRRSAARPWTIMQRIDHPDIAPANEAALEDLAGGATGLVLTFAGAVPARGFGMADADARTLSAALRDVELHAIALRLEAGRRGREAADAFRTLVAARSLNPERLDVSFALDPIGSSLAAGHGDPEAAGADVVAAVKSLSGEYRGPFVEADGRPFHEQGAGEAQELGAVLAVAVYYLRCLSTDLDDEKLARAVGVTLAADADVFLSIAKFRAMRLLWRQVLSSSALAPAPLHLHGETSWRMLTRYDVHTNMLRMLAACFAAGVGGADSIAVLPHTAVNGLADGFARRMARNIQNILQAECGLHRVDDPVAGSAYVDSLTAELASRAWSFFQSIEAEGGILTALRSGFVRKAMAGAATERHRRIATRERPILGSTVFVEADEVAPEASAAAGWGMRDAEVFERLRAAAERLPARPRVFLATLGTAADHGTAATDMRNLLAIAGVDCTAPAPYTTAAEAVAAFKASGASIVAVCASGTARWKGIAVAALEAAGAGWVIDGPPPDALAFVRRLHAELGIGES